MILSMNLSVLRLLWMDFNTWYLAGQNLVWLLTSCFIFNWDKRAIILLALVTGSFCTLCFDALTVTSVLRNTKRPSLARLVFYIIGDTLGACLIYYHVFPDINLEKTITVYGINWSIREMYFSSIFTKTVFELKQVVHIFLYPNHAMTLTSAINWN